MTSTYWPSAANVTCTLPEVLVRAARSFEMYYLAKHTGRRLTWQPSMGTADVRVQFKSRKHDLTVSTIALVILLLFEDLKEDDFLTYEVSRPPPLYIAFMVQCVFDLLKGNQNGDRHPRQRALAKSPITGLCKVQDFEEAPARPRGEPRRLLLVQQ